VRNTQKKQIEQSEDITWYNRYIRCRGDVYFKIDLKEVVYANVDWIHPALITGLNVGPLGAG
jgi:hypothetical protein